MAGLVFDAVAQNASPGTATVAHVQGKARFSIDKRTWDPMRNGSVMGSGAVIQTADNSKVELRVGDGESVELAANTVLAIDQLTSESGAKHVTELDLTSGEITGNAGQLAEGARHEIKYANGVIGVRAEALSRHGIGNCGCDFGRVGCGGVFVQRRKRGDASDCRSSVESRFDDGHGYSSDVGECDGSAKGTVCAADDHGESAVESEFERPGNGRVIEEVLSQRLLTSSPYEMNGNIPV